MAEARKTKRSKPGGAGATRAAPASKRPPVRARPAPPGDEGVVVVGGRFLWIAIVLGTVVFVTECTAIGRYIEPKTQFTNTGVWQIGRTADVSLTLITADSARLACAQEQAIEGDGAHCGWRTETEPWPRDPAAPLDDNNRDVIQPYRTAPDNKLILVAGLWADPQVAKRLHREPFQGVQEKKLARFVVDCKMKFVGSFADAKLRWGSGAKFASPPPADKVLDGRLIVARPERCGVREQ
jgi:hypothetical protein